MTTRNPVFFNNRPFQSSHGRAPRGRGSWAFAYGWACDVGVEFSPLMTYAEAKKWATERARLHAAAADAPEDVILGVDVLP